MQAFDPTQFGITMGQLVTEYRHMFAWLAVIPHIAILILLYLILRFGNRYRRAFTIYNIISYIWLLIWVGGWFSVQLYQIMGPIALAMYIGTPVMLAIILYQWIQELRNPRLDLDMRGVAAWRWIVAVPMFVWGFWYPPYEWGVRLIFAPSELLFGAYGLMGCPTTLVALAILFLKYPAGNRPLFHILTAYAAIIGLVMVALKYVPDIPFFIMGLIALAVIIVSKIRTGRQAPVLDGTG